MYRLCVNVYCTTATGCLPNCSWQIYHIISYHIISYHIISHHIISHHITSHHISYHIISYHIISYHIISHHIITSSHHIISYHIIYHIQSHHIIYRIIFISTRILCCVSVAVFLAFRTITLMFRNVRIHSPKDSVTSHKTWTLSCTAVSNSNSHRRFARINVDMKIFRDILYLLFRAS